MNLIMTARADTKNRILQVGAEIIHRRGFNNTGIQEILRAADVPKGSFYFYFRSKNDFGLQLIDYYESYLVRRLQKHLSWDQLSPLTRLRGFFAEFRSGFGADQCRGGCPIGNLAQEMGDLNEDFRLRLESVFEVMQGAIGQALHEAADQGELAPGFDTGELAGFILNSWQGAILQMKVCKSLEPLESFERIIFESTLSRGTPAGGGSEATTINGKGVRHERHL